MTINLQTYCRWCQRSTIDEYNVTRDQVEAWRGGELIQDAMPQLNSTERETLISGMCPKCQEEEL